MTEKLSKIGELARGGELERDLALQFLREVYAEIKYGESFCEASVVDGGFSGPSPVDDGREISALPTPPSGEADESPSDSGAEPPESEEVVYLEPGVVSEVAPGADDGADYDDVVDELKTSTPPKTARGDNHATSTFSGPQSDSGVSAPLGGFSGADDSYGESGVVAESFERSTFSGSESPLGGSLRASGEARRGDGEPAPAQSPTSTYANGHLSRQRIDPEIIRNLYGSPGAASAGNSVRAGGDERVAPDNERPQVNEKSGHEKPVHEKPIHEKPVHERPIHERLMPGHDQRPAGGHERPAATHDRPLLRRSIGLNDRFLMIRDMFAGDTAAFDRTIDRLEGFAGFDEAVIWLHDNFSLDADSEGVKLLMSLLERKYTL